MRRLAFPALSGALLAFACCCYDYAGEPFVVVPRDDSTRVEVQTASPIGRIELWAPEAVMSERGACSIYPTGAPWRQVGKGWEQAIGTRESYGPGNYRRIRADTIECVGIEFPVDSPVSWTTRLTPRSQRVDIEFRLKNAGTQTIRKAGAALCVKFLDALWWSDDTTFTLSDGTITSLTKLGRDVGPDNRFEAFLIRGEEWHSPFYEKFWGFNQHRVDRPILVSELRAANCCAVVKCERAYCMLSNRVNPCTDMMLALGDIKPGDEKIARGSVSIESETAGNILEKPVKP